MRLRVSLLAAALLCGAAVVFPASGWAARGDASFALKPLKYDPALTATKSYFILDAKPGDVIRDQIRVVNTGGRTGTAYLYAVDATTGQTSGAVYLSRQSPKRDVGAWIRLSQSRVTLAPGKNAVVDYTIRVPATVRPGDHLGGIVAENAQVQQSNGKGALQIKIKHLTIDAVEVQLPGPAVAKVAATGVKAGGEHGFQYVYVHLKATGTVMIKPAATLTVKNSAGRVVAKRSVQLDTFLPGTEIDYPVLLPKQALSPGEYTADVRLRSTKNLVLGYRKAQAAPFDSTHTFPFTVSSGEQTKVYSGAAPVTPNAKPTNTHSSKSNRLLVLVVAVLALLVIAVLGVLFLLLRRGRRNGAVSAAAPSPDASAPEAVAPAKTDDEEPGWAGLLAAYESQPRHRNGWENDDLEELVPVVPVPPVVEAEHELEPGPEPEYEYEPVFEYDPVVEYVPVVEETPLDEYEPVLDYAPLGEPEFVPEPEPVQAPVAAAQPIAVLGPEDLEELIVRHDLAVAEAYFGSHPLEADPVEPEPSPLPARSERPAPDPARGDADVHNLSSALLDASLIALAAVVASRLLKNSD